MHEFKETGTVYVSKSGSNLNDGLTPLTPVLDIATAVTIDSGATIETIVIGTGIYEVENTPMNVINYVGDGVVIFRPVVLSTGTCFINLASNQGGGVKNIIFTGYTNNVNGTTSFNQTFNAEDCIFVGGSNIHGISRANFNSIYQRCRFINGSLSVFRSGAILPDPAFTNSDGFLKDCILVNTNFTVTGVPDSMIQSNYFLDSSTANVDRVRNNFLEGTSIVIGNIENTNTLGGAALFQGSIEDRLEFIVTQNSPLIGAGTGGVNIGNVRAGNLQNFSTPEWGTAPASPGNTAFGASDELILTAGVSSNRDSVSIDLGQIRNSPIIRFNGLTDFLNNVPDGNNALVNPNHLTFQAQWAGLDGIFNGVWRNFRWNERFQLDTLGTANGETGFDWGNLVDIQLRFIMIRTTPRNDYNVA